jgi:lysophospholipase L1-like esterase
MRTHETFRPFAPLLALLLAGVHTAPLASEQSPQQRWEKEIAALEAADREKPPQPGGVVFVGSSSIRLWKTLAEEVAADFRSFCARLHSALPEARLIVTSIKLTPARWRLRESIAFANALLAAHCAGDSRRAFVDINPVMLTPDGHPREDLYVEDRLHLNAAGYRLWRDRLAPLLK